LFSVGRASVTYLDSNAFKGIEINVTTYSFAFKRRMLQWRIGKMRSASQQSREAPVQQQASRLEQARNFPQIATADIKARE
jgi:hypothetical protein